MNNLDLEQLILQHVNRPNYRPVKPKVIAKKLGIPEDLKSQFKRTIKKLAKKNLLEYGANHVVKPLQSSGKSKSNEVVGKFKRNAAGGFGFVRPLGTKSSAGRDEDIFVPAKRTKDAANGDTVRIRTMKAGVRDGSPRVIGEVLEVIERSKNQFVGTYYEQDDFGFVRIDSGEFDQAIFVGDPGAKGAQPDDKVVVEMVRYPTANRGGEGVITEILGKRGEPGVDTLMIIREFNLPEAFPEDVLENARDQAAEFDESIQDGRVDLTKLTVVTIDPVDARDFDDAISLERLENGHWRLGVHIADVSHFVKPGSALDREARERATSVYLPDRVIPMIPEIISNNLASLQPKKVRYTKTAFIEFTAEGARVATDFCSAAIQSEHRFAYEEIDEYLADRESWNEKLSPQVFELVGHMHELAMILRQRRLYRGAIELIMPEIKIDLDKNGKVAGAHRVEHTESHQVIEEFMLAANEAVAERFADLELPCLRRIHESPSPRKLKQLTEFVKEIGIECESLESRFEIKRVLAEVAGKPEEPAVNYAVLRSMQKAVYSPMDEGHFALASQHYCHFTSPIRRYPDLTIHRLMDDVFRNQAKPGNYDALLSLGDHCSEREQRAEQAERELTKLKLLHFLSTKIGEQMEAVITGVEEFGLFAQGLKLPAEGLIHVSELDDDHYHYDPTTHTLMGSRPGHTFRLGDLVRVEIARVDMDLRELDFRIVGRAKTNTGFKKKTAGSIDERLKRNPRAQRRDKNRGTSNQNRIGKPGRGRKGKRK